MRMRDKGTHTHKMKFIRNVIVKTVFLGEYSVTVVSLHIDSAGFNACAFVCE